MDQSNSSLGVEELLAQNAGAGLDDVKDWTEKNLRRIAEHFVRTDFDAIREDYDAGAYDDFLWPADEDEAEFVARFQHWAIASAFQACRPRGRPSRRFIRSPVFSRRWHTRSFTNS
jgi:hypothetical protein